MPQRRAASGYGYGTRQSARARLARTATAQRVFWRLLSPLVSPTLNVIVKGTVAEIRPAPQVGPPLVHPSGQCECTRLRPGAAAQSRPAPPAASWRRPRAAPAWRGTSRRGASRASRSPRAATPRAWWSSPRATAARWRARRRRPSSSSTTPRAARTSPSCTPSPTSSPAGRASSSARCTSPRPRLATWRRVARCTTRSRPRRRCRWGW